MPFHIHMQSTQTKSTVPRAIHPNETVGAVPACPPERPRSGVSIPKIHASRTGIERRMRPCGATRAGTQAPPLHISIIFFRAIPHKQNNHLHAIHPNEINRLRIIHPNETVGAVPVCPPERSHSGVSIQKIHALCTDVNDECAPAGRHGRAHRHRPYQSPLYICAQSHTNKITIYTQSTQTKPTIHTQSTQTKP